MALLNSQCRGRMGFLLARKPGLAPAWKQLGQPFNPAGETEERLVLTPPAALAGVVVDEADKPVANAEVSVAMAVGEISTGRRCADFQLYHRQTGARLFCRPHGCRRPFPHRKFSNQCHGRPCGSGAGKSSAPVTAGFRQLGLAALARGTGRHQIDRGTGRQHRRQNHRRGKQPAAARCAADVAARWAGLFRFRRARAGAIRRGRRVPHQRRGRRFLPDSGRLRHQRRSGMGRGGGSGFG